MSSSDQTSTPVLGSTKRISDLFAEMKAAKRGLGEKKQPFASLSTNDKHVGKDLEREKKDNQRLRKDVQRLHSENIAIRSDIDKREKVVAELWEFTVKQRLEAERSTKVALEAHRRAIRTIETGDSSVLYGIVAEALALAEFYESDPTFDKIRVEYAKLSDDVNEAKEAIDDYRFHKAQREAGTLSSLETTGQTTVISACEEGNSSDGQPDIQGVSDEDMRDVDEDESGGSDTDDEGGNQTDDEGGNDTDDEGDNDTDDEGENETDDEGENDMEDEGGNETSGEIVMDEAGNEQIQQRCIVVPSSSGHNQYTAEYMEWHAAYAAGQDESSEDSDEDEPPNDTHEQDLSDDDDDSPARRIESFSERTK